MAMALGYVAYAAPISTRSAVFAASMARPTVEQGPGTARVTELEIGICPSSAHAV